MENTIEQAAEKLAALYECEFGNKERGRYRLPEKLLRQLMGRRRVYPDDVQQLTRALLERGMVLIDMDSFFVVMAANSFVNYRRLNEEMLK